MTVPTIALDELNSIPQLGFGVWQVEDDQAYTAVGEALKVGYRSIDTAKIYDNEKGTGRAIRESGIDRADLFVTTKLWNDDQGHDAALRAFDASLDRLGLDYVDLYLIHWPTPARALYNETFRAMQEIQQSGRAISIGVSNFRIPDLDALIDTIGDKPAVNQIELHPGFSQPELRKYHEQQGIVTEAWSPLGQGTVLDDPTITAIAREHGKTPAQVILRWHMQIGTVAIPKSVTPSRISENFDIFDFTLTDDEVASITGLDRPDGRIGADPADFG